VEVYVNGYVVESLFSFSKPLLSTSYVQNQPLLEEMLEVL
jgi:hypothetical protein